MGSYIFIEVENELQTKNTLQKLVIDFLKQDWDRKVIRATSIETVKVLIEDRIYELNEMNKRCTAIKVDWHEDENGDCSLYLPFCILCLKTSTN